MKNALILLCAACCVLTLAGCKKTPALQLAAEDVSQETSDSLSALGAAPDDYKFYRYQVDDRIQGLILKCYRLGDDHQWILGDSLTIDRDEGFPSQGQLAVRVDHNEAVILDGPNLNLTYPITFCMEEMPKGSTGTSWICNWDIEPDQEKQLMLRAVSTESHTGMPDEEAFLDADMSQYSAAIGVTVSFFSSQPTS